MARGNAMTSNESISCDVLVVGSGAGGFAAAITAARQGLKVQMVEKASVVGGTTARSGGILWIPCSAAASRAQVQDTIAAARNYLSHETGTHFDARRVDAFLEHGPQMVEFFERETHVQFEFSPFPDYHSAVEGSVPAGRSIGPQPFDGRKLGVKLSLVAAPLPEMTVAGMMVAARELLHFQNATRSFKSARYVIPLFFEFWRDRLLHGRPMRLTNGNALIGRLLRSAIDLGIPILTSSPLVRLNQTHGKVTGGIVETKNGPLRIDARCAVILATGGFPHDVALRKKLFRHAPTGQEHWSPGAESNTGDGWRLATGAGASTVEDLTHAAAWTPVSRVPRASGGYGLFPHFNDRAKPGVIAVLRDGRRFANESSSYHDFGGRLIDACSGSAEASAFLIADHRSVRRYGLGTVKPFPIPLGAHLSSKYILRGRTLSELALQAGIDAKALEATVREYNAGAREGVDPLFSRGVTAFNRFIADPTHQPNPSMGPIENGPFYALKILVGDLGTFAGLKTNEFAQVLDPGDVPMGGLYAVGNDAASIMGGNYPGAGITIGPAMTFGFIAGRHVAKSANRQ